jgi:hypothetical protein
MEPCDIEIRQIYSSLGYDIFPQKEGPLIVMSISNAQLALVVYRE